MAEHANSDAASALQASDLAHRQAAYDADYELRLAVHQARLKIFQDSTDRARSSAEFCRNAAATIGTLYSGLLGVTFAAKDAIPLPSAGVIPALFLALSLVLSATYVAFITPGHPTAAPKPHSSLAVDQDRRVNAFGVWITALVGRRVAAMQSAVLSLGAGVAFLPAPFVGWDGVVLWAVAALVAVVVVLGPFALSRLREARRSALAKPMRETSSTQPQVSPTAAMLRGTELLERGNPSGAAAAFGLVVASRHPTLSPHAAVELGYARGQLNDVEGARKAYELAIDSGDPAAMPRAARRLAALCADAGDIDAAAAAYKLAMDSGDRRTRAFAAFDLGSMMYRHDRFGAAREALETAVETGVPRKKEEAALLLGRLLADHGYFVEARAALEQAMESSESSTSGLAAVRRADVLLQLDGIEAAIDAYRAAIERRSAFWERAALHLGDVLRDRGDGDGARAAYSLAYESKDWDSSYRAALELGRLLEAAEDPDGALEAYLWAQTANDDDDTVAAAKAALTRLGWRGPEDADRARLRGLMLRAQGDIPAARDAFQEAIDIGEWSGAEFAAIDLGDMLVEDGDLAGAVVAYRRAVQMGNSSSRAGLPLGRLLRRKGDLTGARDAYRCAVATRQADAASRAALALGRVLEDLGADREEILDAFRTAEASPDELVRLAAIDALARMGERAGAG